MNNKSFKIKAREMPNFSKIVPKQIESNRELTVPQGFELASERLHREAQQLKREKLELQQLMEQKKRKFKSKPLPDYESLELTVMPSAKPSTIAMKPVFASDKLTKKAVKVAVKKDDGPKDFQF